MEKSLTDIKSGHGALVVKIDLTGALKRRVMDMGITKGAVIHVCKPAPFGDPLRITVRGFQLSIRKRDAKMIMVIELKNI